MVKPASSLLACVLPGRLARLQAYSPPPRGSMPPAVVARRRAGEHDLHGDRGSTSYGGPAPRAPAPLACGTIPRTAADIEQAIRTRRTHKAFGREPVERDVLDELFELARWAPNHHGTNPWRFRVLGPDALAQLKQAAGPEQEAKLDRAPTLIVVSAMLGGDPVQDEEDLHAAAIAAYIVLLVAHARGFAGYWRTPDVLRTDAGREAVGLGAGEHVLGLLHLGPVRQESAAPEREEPDGYVTYLA